jgi:hypothetical protein
MTFDPSGVGGRYYDWEIGRWLPVDRRGLSPDGSHYAVGGGTNDLKPILHIFDIATGADRVYPLPPALTIGLSGPTVIGYTASAIYIGLPTEVGMQGLWTFDISTHTTTFMEVDGLGLLDGATAWRSMKDAADEKASPVPGSVPPASQVDRLDLTSGEHDVWLHSPGHGLAVIGVDTNHDPIVLDSIDTQTVEVLMLTSPSTQSVIYQGPANEWSAYLGNVYSDAHGVWFGGSMGVYLYTAGKLVKITDQAAVPAGDCHDQS